MWNYIERRPAWSRQSVVCDSSGNWYVLLIALRKHEDKSELALPQMANSCDLTGKYCGEPSSSQGHKEGLEPVC